MTQDEETDLVGDIARVNAAARELVTITALLQGIFFAVVSLSDLRRLQQWQLALFMLPLVFWLLCLIFAMQAFMLREYQYGDPSEKQKQTLQNKVKSLFGRDRPAKADTTTRPPNLKEAQKEARKRKFGRLRLAYATLWISLVFLLFDICLYLFVLPPPPTSCLPICSTPTIAPSP